MSKLVALKCEIATSLSASLELLRNIRREGQGSVQGPVSDGRSGAAAMSSAAMTSCVIRGSAAGDARAGGNEDVFPWKYADVESVPPVDGRIACRSKYLSSSANRRILATFS